MNATKSAHTRGDWQANLEGPFTLDGDTVEIEAIDSEGMVTRQICTCMIDTTDWPDSKEAKKDAANVRLLAASPDLLAACEAADALIDNLFKAVPWGKTFNLDIQALNEVPIQIQRAVAKARGEK